MKFVLATILASGYLLALAESAILPSTNDASKLTYLLDGMTEFRLEINRGGLCVDKDLKLSPCAEGVEDKKWKWDEERLFNTKTQKCLAYNKITGKFYFESCSDEDDQDVSLEWGCEPKGQLKIMGKKGYCIQISDTGNWTAIDCDEKSATIFNIFIGNPFKPYRIMPCVLKEELGNRTNNPQYYYFMNDAFKITWSVKYVKFYIIFGRQQWQMILAQTAGDVAKAEEKIKTIAVDGISQLDKAYRKINLRLLLTGYEIWTDDSPIDDSTDYSTLKPAVRKYSHEYLRKKYDFHGSIYYHGKSYFKSDGKTLGIAGSGMGDLCKTIQGDEMSEMFIMATTVDDPIGFANLISHEFGHEVFQSHNFEPGKPCPQYRMYGAKCTMGGNDYPKGFSSSYFKQLQALEAKNLLQCMPKPDMQAIQSPKTCGNGILEVGEECDCGSSEECKKTNPCCDGLICKFKGDAKCDSGKCCSNCKKQITGDCAGMVETRNDLSGVISETVGYNKRHNWKIVGKEGSQIRLNLNEFNFEFHLDCSYDYLEIRDGPSSSSKLIGKYCDKRIPPATLKSSSNSLFITYQADNSYPSTFTAVYMTENSDNSKQGSFGIELISTGKKSTVCEGKSKNFRCTDGKKLAIKYANYGRTNTANCVKNQKEINCVSASATSMLQKQCDGKSSCKVYSNDDTFGDPCPAISKFLQVYWDCVEDGKPVLKSCLTYSQVDKGLKFQEQAECNDKFKWLNNNILYHESTKMSINKSLQLTHNCFSWDAVHIKTPTQAMVTPNDGRCWKNESGKPGFVKCDSSGTALFRFH